MWPKPDPKSSVPISEQVARLVRGRIASGRLAEGEKLASVRVMAAEVLVNPNTVAKVYRELEREGLLLAKPGSGYRVAHNAQRATAESIQINLKERLREIISEARAAGLAGEALQELIEAAQYPQTVNDQP